MDVKEALNRDWSSIPPELLHFIAKSIREVSDFIRFRAVCSTWRSSIQITDLPAQFPWISKRHLDMNGDLTFYSITFRKTYSITTTKSLDKFFYGPSEGYMFTRLFDRTKCKFTSHRSLLNPLNNHEIPLPSYTNRYCFAHDCKCLWIGPRKNQMGEYVAFLCDQGLLVWHLRQNKLSTFGLVCKPCSYFCLKGMIFGADKLTGHTTVTDINNTCDYAYVIPPVEGHSRHGNVYIVDAYEDILRVFAHPDRKNSVNCFDVHRLDVSENNSACWIKINNIGDQAIFIDTSGGFVIQASESAGIKRNCIYFLKRIERRTIYEYEVIRIDIETMTQEVFECPFGDPLCWFMPNLHYVHTS